MTDLQLDDGHSGWTLVQEAFESYPHCMVIAVSGHLPAKDPVAGRFRDRFAKFSKPISEEALAGRLGVTAPEVS
ncbi:hypothetical protein QW131_28750 [Roseibium salinum]|nr:hypothetical protein [Roseibium salinum]